MKEILLTSSVLITALLLLRRVFRRSISRRAQYALWALVLLRLLIPYNLPNVEHNVLAAAEPVARELGAQAIYVQPSRTQVIRPEGTEGPFPWENDPGVTLGPVSQDNTYTYTDKYQVTHNVEYERQIALSDVLLVMEHFLRPVWYAGMALMALWFLVSNLRFGRKLRKGRTPYPVENCPYRVYLAEEGLPSPCLFGLFRPTIYLTPAAIASPEALRHVLAHETTHARHLDPLWSLLRAVCLTVYWFDPLVWAAAIASKNDCELACDEGAVRVLGEEERIAYGKTLLSLIPVGRGPGNPLLSATTMTAGKKQLKDRITRIAENRRTLGAALFAVLAIAALVCAATFTEPAAHAGGDSSSINGAVRSDGPLTGDELLYFNTRFFNGTDVYGQEVMNIRNQFLASTYERPEDVGLLEIFYSGIPNGEITAETGADISAGWPAAMETAFGGEGPDCATYALSTAEMDALLVKYIGLTVAETNRVGLDDLAACGCYLPEYDAYYWAHGDTLYRGQVSITAGEREGGLVRLYYEDRFYGDGWKCATLREVEDGRYHFVSNLPCEIPAIPTAYPAEEPWKTISLTELDPLDLQGLPMERHSMDCARRGGGVMVGDDSRFTLRPYLSTDGNYYAAIIRDEAAGRDGPAVWEADVFLTMSPINSLEWGETTINTRFMGEFAGHSVLELSYLQKEGDYPVSFCDYYYFQPDGTPVLLLRAQSVYETKLIDLDGDGTMELVSVFAEGAAICFERDGAIYRADVRQLLSAAWPEMSHWDFAELNRFDRCLFLRGFMDMTEWGQDAQADFRRTIYFTPEALLAYTNLTDTMGHMALGIGEEIPEDIRQDALAQAAAAYEQANAANPDAPYDDWRVSALSLTGTYTDLPVEGTLEAYSVSWELHAENPAGVIRAGGMYLLEDGWTDGSYQEDSPYLVYLLKEDGAREKVESLLTGGYAEDSQFFRADLCRSVVQSGLTDMADLEARDLFYMLYKNPTIFLNELEDTAPFIQRGIFEKIVAYADTCPPAEASLFEDVMDSLSWNSTGLTEAGQAAYQRLLARPGSGLFFQELMDKILAEDTVLLELANSGDGGSVMYESSTADGSGSHIAKSVYNDFRWTRVDADWPREGRSLRISPLRDDCVIEFWEGTGLVRCSRQDSTIFYQTEPLNLEDIFTQDIFQVMRFWFDEVEYNALREDILVPDRGQSRLEIAQEWSERATAAGLRATPGSRYACTFVRTTANVEEWEYLPEDSYPDDTAGRDRFWFGYTRVFVPENEWARNTQMAGNTGEYTGSDPDVPAGAYENNQVGVLYLSDDGWRCDGTGTGP